MNTTPSPSSNKCSQLQKAKSDEMPNEALAQEEGCRGFKLSQQVLQAQGLNASNSRNSNRIILGIVIVIRITTLGRTVNARRLIGAQRQC